MNLILLFPSDFVDSNIVSLTGRRLQHALEILKPKKADELVVGVEGGKMGKGIVVEINEREMRLEVVLSESPPPKLPLILCVALMRPIVLKRVLSTAVSMGVESIVLFHSAKVEKSFWQSTALEEGAVRDQMILGLEQAKDTVLPQLLFEKRFKPFVEDVLPELLKGRVGVVADPSGSDGICLTSAAAPSVLIIGPESGFVPYEVGKFCESGCRVVSLGQRILKVETAMVFLLSRMAGG